MNVSTATCSLLHRAYGFFQAGFVRWVIIKVVARFDGGYMKSLTLRKIFKDYHGVDIGLYTWGGCFVPRNFGRRVSIGRYCSVAMNAFAFTRNHPLEWKSTHELFYNPVFKYCPENRVEITTMRIGNDVWIGAGALITPSVEEIGDGAVIAAGAVVHRNVPPYAIVAGNPARVVRFRFSDAVIKQLLASRWWEMDIEQLQPHIKDFQGPYEPSRPHWTHSFPIEPQPAPPQTPTSQPRGGMTSTGPTTPTMAS